MERRTQLPSRHDPENPATYPFLHVGAREIHVMNGTLHAILGTCSHIFFAELTAGLGAYIYFAAYVTSAYACNSRAFNSTLDRMSLHDIFLGLQTFLCHDSYQCSSLGGLLFLATRLALSAMELCLTGNLTVSWEILCPTNQIFMCLGRKMMRGNIAWYQIMGGGDWIASTLSWNLAWSYSRLAGLDYRNSILHLQDKMEGGIGYG